MKPVFENISLKEKGGSLKFFHLSEPFFKSYWHFHPEMELTYIIKGEGTRYVGDSIANFKEGDLVLLGKNIPHNWASFNQNTEEGVEALVIQFPETILSQYAEFSYFSTLTQASEFGLHFTNPNPRVLKLIRSFSLHNDALRLIRFFELLYKLMESEHRKLSSTGFALHKLNKKESRINNLKAYIEENISGPISIAQMAAHMQMTESYFCRWFKRNTGNTLIQYVNKLRIEMVCRELIYSDGNISQIAYENGFENISHFNRVFKELKHMSPSIYRKSLVLQANV